MTSFLSVRSLFQLSSLAAVSIALSASGCGGESNRDASGGAAGSDGAAGNGTGGSTASGGSIATGGAVGSGGAGTGGSTPDSGIGGTRDSGIGGTRDSGSSGVSCKVDDQVYPDGATNVPDPASCNTCVCENGELTSCTEVACPEACPRDHALGKQCAQCGPTDGCEVVEHGCFSVCDNAGHCRDGGACIEGVCVTLCG